jgi:hypothetical protein
LGWKWAQDLAAGIAVIAALATFIWGLRLAFVLMATQLYVVIGQALERTSTQGDGLLVATEIEHSALRVNIDRCLQVDERGRLSPSDRWSGIGTFPGSSDLVEVVPDGQTVVLVCRDDGRIIERPSATTR